MEKTRPNVVIILSDDQGAWALGSAGNRELLTPTLDELAANGMRFENFFCVSPVCSPARASLLTGRIPSSHGIQDWLKVGNINDPSGKYRGRDRAIGYLDGMEGFTDFLAASGYVCGLSGKWHLGDSARPQKGYTYWQAYAFGGGDYYNYQWFEKGEIITCTDYISDHVTDKALDFLREREGHPEPFLLSVHYTAPHSPWTRNQHPADVWHLYDDCPFESVPIMAQHPWQSPSAPCGRTPALRREYLQGYFSAITAMDRGIARILDRLREMNVRDNTIVLFMGDNGMNMGHHGIWGKGNGTFPLNMYDSSVKVPCIISWPGNTPQNTVATGMHSHYDIFPTMLDIAGVPNPVAAHLPGTSFAPLLQGKADTSQGAVVVYDEYGPVRMVRTTDWKYVHRFPYGPHELYHIADDPDETSNLVEAPEYASKIAEMRGMLRSWFAKYVNPEKDAAYEGVNGFGQLGRTGLEGDGSPVWAPMPRHP